jgi:hypothetical protein
VASVTGGVNSVAGLSGDVEFSAGDNMEITTNGQALVFAATGLGGDLTALSNDVLGAWATASNAQISADGVGADLTNRFTAGYSVPAWNGAAITGLTASGGTDTGAVQKTGDTMTGALVMDVSTQMVIHGQYYITTGTNANDHGRIGIGGLALVQRGGVAIGQDANASGNTYYGVAIGSQANGGNEGVSVGYLTKSYGSGVAIGSAANGGNYGVSVGPSSVGIDSGTAIGRSAVGTYSAVAVGYNAAASYSSIAIGAAKANSRTAGSYLESSVAIGGAAKATNAVTSLSVGRASDASNGTNRQALGFSVTNVIDESTAIRGSLYLDGGTGIYSRATFGSGGWYQIGVVITNVWTGGTMTVKSSDGITGFWE